MAATAATERANSGANTVGPRVPSTEHHGEHKEKIIPEHHGLSILTDTFPTTGFAIGHGILRSKKPV
jgi:hypothetical protein